jgi:hypothetical protein
MPTPMVAASAAAILKDITLSRFRFRYPAGVIKFLEKPCKTTVCPRILNRSR